MALNELVSVPFLVSIVITCVLVAAVSFLFYNRLHQQTTKITAIMDLMTTLVNEVNSLKVSKSSNEGEECLAQSPGILGEIHKVNIGTPMPFGINVLDPLIDVSEDEDEDDDDQDEDEDEDEDDDMDDEDDGMDEDEDEDEDDGDGMDEDEEKVDIRNKSQGNGKLNMMDISIIGFNLKNSIGDNTIGESEQIEELSDDEIDIDVANLNFEEFAEEHSHDDRKNELSLLSAAMTQAACANIKSESKIIEIGEQDVTDYTKYTTSELRKIAFSRGLIGDNDKSAKNKLIKLISQQ